MTSPARGSVELTIDEMARRTIANGGRQIGVDAVDIGSFSRMLERAGTKLKARWFTDRELAFAADESDRLAATLAGKEAVAKALGTGIRGPVRWRTIEILRRPDGQPTVLLHDGARDRARSVGIGAVAISLCHEAGLALAVASGVPDRSQR